MQPHSLAPIKNKDEASKIKASKHINYCHPLQMLIYVTFVRSGAIIQISTTSLSTMSYYNGTIHNILPNHYSVTTPLWHK